MSKQIVCVIERNFYQKFQNNAVGTLPKIISRNNVILKIDVVYFSRLRYGIAEAILHTVKILLHYFRFHRNPPSAFDESFYDKMNVSSSL